MTTINAPIEKGETKNTNSRDSISSLYRLTEQGISSYIRSSQSNQLNALSYLDGNESKLELIRKQIFNAILAERGSFGKESNEANISESDIMEYLTDISRIRRIILDETISRRSLENSVWLTLQNRYPKDSLQIAKVKIVDAIRKSTDSDLSKILLRRDLGHKNLIQPFVNPAPLFRSMDDLANELGIQNGVINNDPSVKYILQNYLETGYMGSGDIDEIIHSQPNLSIEKKRKILTFFIPTISLYRLEAMGIITTDKKKKAEEIINSILTEQGKITPDQNIYDILPTDEIKNEIAIWIDHIEGLAIPTDQLSDVDIDRFFLDHSSNLADAISDHMTSLGHQESIRTIANLSGFKKRIKNELVDNNGNCLISDIDSLGVNSYIISDLGSVEEKAWKVLATDVSIGGSNGPLKKGFSLEGFHSNGATLGMASHTEYDVLFNAFQDKIKTGSISISSNKPSYINSLDSGRPFEDFDGFMEWVNSIDPSNKSKKFENGMSFAVTIDGEEEIYRIENLDTNKTSFSIRNKYNHTHSNPRITLEGFYDRMKEDISHFGFHRLADVSTLEKFAANTTIDGIIYEDNQLLIDTSHGHDTHGDDHGHGGHDSNHSKKPVWGFQNENGNVIETQFDGNLVTIFEYQPYQESKKNAEGKRKVEPKIKRTEYSKMTLEGLRSFIETHELTTAVSENPHTKEREEIHDEVHPHFHGRSPLSIFMGMKNFADISKAFSMGTHMITHMLEEQSKMHAAEAMYGFFEKTLGKDHALTMHALMEFSGDIGKAIDEKVAYLKRLAGLPRRKEIKHILLTRPAKPHDILAALIVTAEMAGHLYPDSELQELQGGQYIWFDSVCLALGFDPKVELKKAQDKEANKNSETSEHMHETTLLTRFFKLHQDDSPYIQAIAGGSKFWNAVSSGRSAQSDKGKKEAGEFLGAMDRAEYVVSKMESNEPEIAMGAYPSIYGKDPSAKNLGPAFVWALSNFPNSSHPETSNTFKNMMDGNGVAFHALPFCRNKENSNIYKATMDTLIHSLAHKDPGKYQSMSNAWDKTKLYKPMGEYTFQEDHIRELWLFWKNYNKLLHPILQLTDPYIFTLISDEHTNPHEKSILNSYIKKLGETVATGRLNDTGPDDNIMKMGGYRFGEGSMIVDIDPSDRQKSIKRLLNYINIGQNGDIQNVHQRDQIWNGQIISYIKSMRENENFIDNPELQESQFIKLHDEIMNFLRQKIVERYFSGAEKQDYIRQLSSLGFDMTKSNIHQKEIPGKELDFGGKEAFLKFKTGKKTLSEITQDKSHKFATELMSSSSNDPQYRQVA